MNVKFDEMLIKCKNLLFVLKKTQKLLPDSEISAKNCIFVDYHYNSDEANRK